MTGIDYKAMATAGAQLLDSKAPPSWWTEDGPVDLTILDIATGDCCMTAQSVGNGDYQDGVEFLGIDGDNEEQARCGFYLQTDTYRAVGDEMMAASGRKPSGTEVYAPLTNAWKELIQARRDAAAAQQ
jgi:hypothetical protein